MTVVMITRAGSAVALNDYLSTAPAHDLDAPEGFHERVSVESTVGDCTTETFIEDMRRTRAAHGKQSLKIETYHVIVSQTHEEADPYEYAAGLRLHEMTEKLIAEAFPGHQAKLTTQRDNGHYEGTGAVAVWVPGKWHTHVQVASVSELDATLVRISAAGVETHHDYAAGRAIDSDMKDQNHLRRTADRVVRRELHYNNAAYVEACARHQAGRSGDKITRRDYAMRADPDGPGYSSHDAVRVQLREARALATDWDDYTDRLRAQGLNTRVTGTSGVSYSWTGIDGIKIKARARGKNGLGNSATKAEVEKQCARNKAEKEKGIELKAPTPTFAPPTMTTDRPVPIYLTPDGRPPWDAQFDDYVEHVRQTGGTYEGRALNGLRATIADPWVTDRDRLIAAAPDHGITVEGRVGAPAVTVSIPATDAPGDVTFDSERLGTAWTGRGLDEQINITRTRESSDHDAGQGRETGGAPEQRATEHTGRISEATLAARRAENLRRSDHQRAEEDRRRREPAARDTPAAGPQHSDRDTDRPGEDALRPPRGTGKPHYPARDRLIGNPPRPHKDRGYSR